MICTPQQLLFKRSN